MNTTASRIQIGRVVDFFTGYGNTDGRGAIVAIHGTPNAEPDTQSRGVMRVIRPNDCRVDVILFDGRMLRDIHQCGIDRPGIGIKLCDEVLPDVSHLPAIAAEREAADTLARINAQTKRDAAEAARKIDDPPVFFYNGIKDQKGARLQKCFYSDGMLHNWPAGTVTIYGRDYEGFSAKVRACFNVQNDTDTMTDYFEKDRIRVIPTHPLYAQVCAALQAAKVHSEQRHARRAR